MLDIFTVAFFGHRYIDNPLKVEELLEEQIRRLINEKEYVDFLVGRNGEFDQCVSSTVLRVQKNIRDDNSALVLMLPYPTAEYPKIVFKSDVPEEALISLAMFMMEEMERFVESELGKEEFERLMQEASEEDED